MDSFLSRFVLRAFACFGDLLARRMDEEGNGSVIAAPFAVTLTMCVTVKGNALTEEWVGGMSVPTCRPALLCDICTSRWQRLEDSGNALVETSSIHRTLEGEVQGPYTCRFSSSLSGGALLNTAHSAVHLETDNGNSDKNKRQSKTPLNTTSPKASFDGRLQNRRRNDLSVRSAVWWQTVSPKFPISVSKRHYSHTKAMLSLEKSPRPACLPRPWSECGQHSAVRGSPMDFCDYAWWPPLFFPTQYGQKNHWIPWHCQFKN